MKPLFSSPDSDPTSPAAGSDRLRRLRPGARGALALGLGLGAVALAALWSRSPTPKPEAQAATLFAVKARYLQAQQRPRVYCLHAVAEPVLQVVLRAQVAGTVQACPVTKGTWVEAGTPLVQLSLEGRETEVQKAQAAWHERCLQYAATQKLVEQGYASARLAAEHLRDQAQAQAAWEAATSQLEKTCVRAPFAGVWNTCAVEVGDAVLPGVALGTCLDPRVLKVVGYVHAAVAEHLKTGMTVQVKRSDQNLPFSPAREGQLSYVSAQADPHTHLYRVEAKVPNPEQDWAAGGLMSLELAYCPEPVHSVLMAWLTWVAPGKVGVKTVDATGCVVTYPVTIVGSDAQGLYVTGLPPACWVITRGQGFVTEGQAVNVVQEDNVPPGPVSQQIEVERGEGLQPMSIGGDEPLPPQPHEGIAADPEPAVQGAFSGAGGDL